MPFTHAGVKVPSLTLGPLRGGSTDLDTRSVSGTASIRPKATSALGGLQQQKLKGREVLCDRRMEFSAQLLSEHLHRAVGMTEFLTRYPERFGL